MSFFDEGSCGGQIEKAAASTLTQHNPGVTDKLRAEKKELELRLEAINELLAQLEANPDTADIIDNIARLGGRRLY